MKIKLQTGKEVCLKDFHCTPLMLVFWLEVQKKKALKIALKNSKKKFQDFLLTISISLRRYPGRSLLTRVMGRLPCPYINWCR